MGLRVMVIGATDVLDSRVARRLAHDARFKRMVEGFDGFALRTGLDVVPINR